MTDQNLPDVNHEFVSSLNREVLQTIRYCTQLDLEKARMVFGLPRGLAQKLSGLSDREIACLSEQAMSVLCLRHCEDEQLWDQLLQSATQTDSAYQLNLQALMMMHFARLHGSERPALRKVK